jgi:hypothetical protein
MTPRESADRLAAFVAAQEMREADQSADLASTFVIVCPDCGKQIAFRYRCPKCGGASWIPAGHAGGIFERQRAALWRRFIVEDG